MKNKQRNMGIVWTLQILALLSIAAYLELAGRFRLVFDGMGIELPALSRYAMGKSGPCVYAALVIGLFALFLWFRKTGRLNGKVGAFLCYWPLLLVLGAILLVGTALFAPVTSAMNQMDGSAALSRSSDSWLTDRSMNSAGWNKAVGLGRLSPVAESPLPALPETARYATYDDNPVKQVDREPLSTFGLDVSTAGYANVRRFLNAGRFPTVGAVRVEEMLNYFPALPGETQPVPLGDSPFRASCQLAPCPWDKDRTLLWVSILAAGLDYQEAPPANLVFLVDVSGSMGSPERLPLVQASLKLLVDRLRPQDRVSLVTYANGSRIVLDPTSGSDRAAIRAAIDQLTAGGGTAGSAGLQLAYDQAQKAYVKGGVNRIILCTDGDFNIGVSDDEELKAMLTRKRGQNVTLSILGYGTNNLNDALMVQLTAAGNGNYSYVDTLSEARKVLAEEMESTLIVVAKDVKAQIEFNPATVREYRQIGYEKRQLNAEDFNNDKVDAGEVGVGKKVTVLYELALVGQKSSVDPLRYGKNESSTDQGAAGERGGEIAFLKVRWKEPDGDTSSLVELPLDGKALSPTFEEADSSLRFAAAVAAFGQKLRNNPRLSDCDWKAIARWADAAKGSDDGGYRGELVRLIELAGSLEKTE